MKKQFFGLAIILATDIEGHKKGEGLEQDCQQPSLQVCIFCLRTVNAKAEKKHSVFTLLSASWWCLGGDASVLSPLPLCATSPPRRFPLHSSPPPQNHAEHATHRYQRFAGLLRFSNQRSNLDER